MNWFLDKMAFDLSICNAFITDFVRDSPLIDSSNPRLCQCGQPLTIHPHRPIVGNNFNAFIMWLILFDRRPVSNNIIVWPIHFPVSTPIHLTNVPPPSILYSLNLFIFVTSADIISPSSSPSR